MGGLGPPLPIYGFGGINGVGGFAYYYYYSSGRGFGYSLLT